VVFEEEQVNRDHAQRVLFTQLKRTVPIGAVLAKYSIELKRIGTNLKGCCPIHKGSNPRQFVVDESKGLWRCFSPSCDRGGDMLSLVAELEKVEIREAALLVAEWFCIKPGSEVQHRNQQRSTAMSGGRPTMKAFVVEDKEEGSDEKPFWTRVGSCWPHGDGKGLNIQLASGVAVSGRLVLREYTDKDAEEDEKKGTKFAKKK
jgi:CHC2 zinc finger